MKINELQISKDLHDLMPMEILRKYGWKLLGSGIFSAVAEHPNKNYALKLFQNDPRYEKFIKFVNTHPNVHLPKISKSIRKLPGNNQYSYIGLEKLNPVSDNKLDTTYFPLICYLVIMASKINLEMTTSTEGMVNDRLKEIGINFKQLDEVDLNEVWEIVKKKPDSAWIKMVNELLSFVESNGLDFLDIHTGNFALRARTLILIDPFS